jgi:hypothetical protein
MNIVDALQQASNLIGEISNNMPSVDGDLKVVDEEKEYSCLWFATVDKHTAEPYIDICIDEKYIKINLENIKKMLSALELFHMIPEERRCEIVELVNSI